MGMARAGRGHVREQGGIVPRFTRCGQWRGRGEERACDERLGHFKYQCGDVCMHRTNVGLARRWEAVAGGIGGRGGAPSRGR